MRTPAQPLLGPKCTRILLQASLPGTPRTQTYWPKTMGNGDSDRHQRQWVMVWVVACDAFTGGK